MLARIRRRLIRFQSSLKTTILIIVVVFILYGLIQVLLPAESFLQKNQITRAAIYGLIFDNPGLLKQTRGKTNILILGIGGGSHEGPDLTDSIMVMSMDLEKKDLAMITIPRDIWLTSLKEKINAAYPIGENKQKGGGLILAKAAVEEVIGQPIHYSYLLDFNGFQKLIDIVGGIDINIDRAFDDDDYPIPGKENDLCGKTEIIPPSQEADHTIYPCRFEHIRFEAGWQHLDGETALKYVRSRHAMGSEGTDFARSKRQQKVIVALKDKLLHGTKPWDLTKDKKILKAFDDATDTDMTLGEMLVFGRYFLGIKEQDSLKINLEMEDQVQKKKGYLVNPPLWEYDGAWVLIPRAGKDDFSEIHRYIECQLFTPHCGMTP